MYGAFTKQRELLGGQVDADDPGLSRFIQAFDQGPDFLILRSQPSPVMMTMQDIGINIVRMQVRTELSTDC